MSPEVAATPRLLSIINGPVAVTDFAEVLTKASAARPDQVGDPAARSSRRLAAAGL